MIWNPTISCRYFQGIANCNNSLQIHMFLTKSILRKILNHLLNLIKGLIVFAWRLKILKSHFLQLAFYRILFKLVSSCFLEENRPETTFDIFQVPLLSDPILGVTHQQFIRSDNWMNMISSRWLVMTIMMKSGWVGRCHKWLREVQ